MEYETRLGLRREHDYDSVQRYVQEDPDTISYPKRPALFLRQSHIFSQGESTMRNYANDAEVDRARYRETDEQAPYQPPKRLPREPQQPPAPPDSADVDMDFDEIAGMYQLQGPPPPGPPSGYGEMIHRPNTTAHALEAEGIRPAPPLEPPAVFANFQGQPPPPPSGAGSAAIPSPITHPQSFMPGYGDAYQYYHRLC